MSTHTARGLVVDSISAAYEGKTVLDNVSFHVNPGEIVALLGPSGSGKSTLLRCLVGLEPVLGGRVTWDGEDVVHLPAHKRGFGLMFQEGQLFPHRNVGGNIAYGLKIAHMPAALRDDRVTELLALVGLDGFAGRAIASLSGGEQQRVALARSLAPRPKLLLLDEPLSALDADLRERLAFDVKRILEETKTTAILVTHDRGEAERVSHRIFVLKNHHVATSENG